MIKLPELWRQMTAGCLASIAFSATYLGMSLVWWIALIIGISVYISSLLLIDRKPETQEIYIVGNLTQNNIDEAVRQCKFSAHELRKVSRLTQVDDKTSDALERMSHLIDEIATNYAQDPRDLDHSLSFVNNHLPKMMDLVKNFASLSERTVSQKSQSRLAKIAESLREYEPHIEVIQNACLENDFKKLEWETSVLGDVMKIDRPRGGNT